MDKDKKISDLLKRINAGKVIFSAKTPEQKRLDEASALIFGTSSPSFRRAIELLEPLAESTNETVAKTAKKYIEELKKRQIYPFANTVDWYVKAGRLGDASALYVVGRWCENNSVDGKPNYANAAAWYKSSADRGYYFGAKALARMCAQGRVGGGESSLVMENAAALGMLGDFYFYGLYVKRDITHAIALARRAAAMGSKDASANLATYCSWGLIDGGLNEAIKYSLASFDLKNPEDAQRMVQCYSMLTSTPDRENWRRAIEILDASVESGNDIAKYLAEQEQYARNLDAIDDDELRQISAYKRRTLIDGGMLRRDAELAYLDYEGAEEPECGIGVDFFNKLKAQAEAGDPNAQYIYGTLCVTGQSPIPEPDAIGWMKRAVEAGQLQAMTFLSSAYFSGSFGAEQDEEEGLRLCRRAAEAGYVTAQIALAMILRDEENYEETLYWYERAAEGGDEESAFAAEELRRALAESADEMFDIAGAGERYDIFISWNHNDKDYMESLVDGIESFSFSDDSSRDERAYAHYRAWQSDRDASGLIDKCIRSAINNSKFFIVLLSRHSVASDWVAKEVSYALERVERGEWSEENIIAIYTDEQSSVMMSGITDKTNPFYKLKSYTGAFVSGDSLDTRLVSAVCERIKCGFEAEAIRTYIRKQTVESDSFKFLLRNQYDDAISFSSEEIEMRKSTIIRTLLTFDEGYLARKLYLMSDGGRPTTEREALKSGRSFFVYGSGGSGKSLFLTNLVRTNFKARSFFIRLNLIDYEGEIESTAHLTTLINRELNRYLTDADEYRSERPLIRARGKGGENSITIILDGFDEIGEKARASLIGMIAEYRRSEERDRFIFSGRREASYHELTAVFGSSLDLYEMRGFDEEEQRSLYDVIRQKVGELSYVKGDEELKADFFLALGELSEEIRKNPMLLSNLIFIYLKNRGRDFPRKKYEIVDKSVGIIIGELEAERGVRFEYASYISGDRLSAMLSFIAYRKLGGTPLDLEQLLCAYMREVMAEECARRGDEPDEVGRAIYRFLSRRAIISKEKITHDIFTAYFACIYAYNRIYKTLITEKRVDFADRLYLEDALRGGYDEDLAREDGAWPEIASELIMKLDFEIHSVDPRHAMNERNRSYPVFDETLRLSLTERGISEKAVATIEAMAAEPEGFYFVDFIRAHLPANK